MLKCQDIGDEPADVLICSSNIFLNLSGGVGGELLARYGMPLQQALHGFLDERPGRFARQGEIFETQLPVMPYRAVLHAVAVDQMYHSDSDVVTQILKDCFRRANELGAQRVALTALGTGFGSLPLSGFAQALASISHSAFGDIREAIICLAEEDRVEELRAELVSRGFPIQ